MIGGSASKRQTTTAATAAASRIRIGNSVTPAASIVQENEGVGLYSTLMIPKDATASALELARRVLAVEADAVRALIARLDERFLAAVTLILGCEGRVIVSGIGKSGHVARKIASTLSSTGTRAYFVHSAEASHRDLGLGGRGDGFLA